MSKPPQIKYRGALYRLAGLDPKLEKNMLKVRKGSDVPWKQLLEIFAHIGWKVERTTDFADHQGTQPGGFFFNIDHDMYYDVVPVQKQYGDRVPQQLEKTPGAPFLQALLGKPAQQIYDAFKAREIGQLPDVAKPGEFYVLNVSEPELRSNDDLLTWTQDIIHGWHGFLVTATNGDSFFVPMDMAAKTRARSPRRLSGLTAWLSKESTFKQEVLDAIGVEEHVPAAQRTKENTATCSVCWRNIKLKGTTMVLHGYQRPGWGYTVGSCPGTRQQPYELSAQGCQKYIKKYIDPAIASAQEFIENGKAGRFKTLTIRKEEITPDDPSWDRYLEGAIASRENELRSISRDQAKYQALVDGWERLPLFGEEGFKQLHTDRFMRKLMKDVG